jgi:hypothetical protein
MVYEAGKAAVILLAVRTLFFPMEVLRKPRLQTGAWLFAGLSKCRLLSLASVVHDWSVNG